MTGAVELARAVEEALAFVTRQPGILEAEIFAAANDALLTRLNYTSHIPSNGVEEPKSTASYGLGIRAAFAGPSGPRIGFGSEPSDLSVAGARRALDRARTSAVADPDFVSLPRPSREPRALVDYHDPALMALDDARLVEAGWKIVGGALRTFTASGNLAAAAGDDAGLRRLGLILSGDVTVLLERVAIASTHMRRVQTDESTLITAFATAMVESRGAKGSGAFAGTRLDHFTDEAGVEAAHHAIAAIGGERVPSGEYTVVFGRQPVADLLNNIVVPACTARAFYSERTPFLGQLGRRVASPELTISDHGALPGLVGSKGITCEGLPTGRTDLIKEGVLVGCLSNWYETQRLIKDKALREKLGAAGAEAERALAPRNGFRFGAGGGRGRVRARDRCAGRPCRRDRSVHGGARLMADARLEAIARHCRVQIIRMLTHAGSGHPGGSLSVIDILTALYFGRLRYDAKRPDWPDRDRVVLSKGHAVPALYAVMARAGFLPESELVTLRKLGSRLQGHPDRNTLPGIGAATGSLGQGLSISLGLALGLKLGASRARVYCILGDGETQEGQVWEAAMAGPKLGQPDRPLDNLCVILDYNKIQLDNFVAKIMDLEPVVAKWQAFGWPVLEIDGHDMDHINKALDQAEATRGTPTFIVAHTVKGKGVSFMENDPEWHGKAPKPAEAIRAIREILGVGEAAWDDYVKADPETRALVDELAALEKK